MNFLSPIKTLTVLAVIFMAVGFPYGLFAQQCAQANILVNGYELRKQDGSQFQLTDNYVVGQTPVSGKIFVSLGGNTTSGYNLSMIFDIYVNGVKFNTQQIQSCLFNNSTQATNITLNQYVAVMDFNWIWGDVVEIKNIFFTWDNGQPKAGTTCKILTQEEISKINSQCYYNSTGFTAVVPLFPKFDFNTNGICNTTIQFTSRTIGGSPPYNYSFSWDFNNDNAPDSYLANPVYTFASTGTYPIKLTVNDGTSTTTISKNIFIDPNFGIQVTIVPSRIGESTGSISITSVTGGQAPYAFTWTGPNNFQSTVQNISGLSSGFYTLVVKDFNQCSQRVDYELDVASILNLQLKSLEIKESGQKMDIRWEVNAEKEGSNYIIERSFGDANNFHQIGEVWGQGNSQAVVKYAFTDDTYPVFEKLIYYRIAYIQGNNKFYSPVKLVRRTTEQPFQSPWVVYPNPSRDGKVNLKFLNGELAPGDQVQIQAMNGSSFMKTIDLVIGSENEISLDQLLGPLPSGLTILRVQWSNRSESFKLIRSD